MHLRTCIAITALAVPVFLTACASEVQLDSDSAASSQTETSAAPDCPEHDPAASALPPQEELARDIRTIVTGEQSPVQQEALAQAARIAPGQMSTDLREVLVDAAAFVSYLDRWDDPVDSRLDSLAHFLVCALQPHFSQEELVADILSITRFYQENDHLEAVRRARQETAALLAMHIPLGEMGGTLQRAVARGMMGIGPGDYPMHMAWYLLSEALSKQYAGYSDADLAAEIRTIRTGEKDIYAIYTPLAAIHGAGRWVHPGYGGVSEPENIGPQSRAAMTEALTWFNEKMNERARLLERLEAAGDEESKKILETGHREEGYIRFLHRMLEEAISSIKEKQQTRQHIREFQDPFRDPEFPQEELVATIRAIMEGEEGNTQFRALRQISRMEPEQIGDSLRAVLKKAFLYKYDAAMQWKEAGADFDFYSYAGSYEVIMLRMEDAIAQLRDPSLIKFFVHLGRYGICGNEAGGFRDPDGIFRQFPDTSAALLTEAISTPTAPFRKMEDGLALLSELAVSHKMGRLRFSREGRALLIATGRRFLEAEFLSSLPMQDTTGAYPVSRSGVLREAIVLAVALDDPGLIEIVEALATDPDRVTALSVPSEEVKYIQENARRLLNWRPYMGISDC